MTLRQLAIIPALFCVMQLSACSWVKLTPDGERVQVLSSDAVASCKKIGATTVSLKSSIAGVKRKQEKVAKELDTLARNSGAKMGGNTVVPISEMENGERSYAVYQCNSI
ncbi:MAG: DUF4156 domain-containing protein [Gammaproteobacteria bacterium]|nr:DUF4156 domain-containing protein [Gammaproteobacteria bacterium]